MVELANRICLRLLLGISVPSYHLVLLLSGRPVPILSPLVHWRRKRARKRWQHWGNCENNELLRLKFLVGSWATVLGGDTTKWNTTPQFLFHTTLINGCDSSATSPNKQPPSNLNIMYKMLVESKERRKGEGVIFRVDALKSPHIGSFFFFFRRWQRVFMSVRGSWVMEGRRIAVHSLSRIMFYFIYQSCRSIGQSDLFFERLNL